MKNNYPSNISREQFDVVTLIEVLEHIPINNVSDFLKSISSLIKPGGKFIITVPSVNLSIKNIRRHFQHFDEESIRSTLSPYFKVDKLLFINKKNCLTKLIDKLFTNSFFILANKKIINFLFGLYLKKGFFASHKNGLRILCVCSKK